MTEPVTNKLALATVSNSRARTVWMVSAVAAAAVLLIAYFAIGGSAPARHHQDQKRYPLALLEAADTTPVSLSANSTAAVQSALSNLPSESQLLTTLNDNAVSISIEGVVLSIGDVANKLAGYDAANIELAAENATKDGLDVQTAVSEVDSPMSSLAEAISFSVLSQLLVNAAIANGTAVTASAAQIYAQQQYATYEQSQSSAHPLPLPAGTTPQSEFLSSTAIAGYQRSLTVTQEITTIAGPPNPEQSRTPILSSWMTAALAGADVQIANAPIGVNGLASALPSML